MALLLGRSVLSVVSLFLEALFLMPGFPCTLVIVFSTEANLLATCRPSAMTNILVMLPYDERHAFGQSSHTHNAIHS